jgi:hypothetical protein
MQAIDLGLQVKPESRSKSVDEWRKRFRTEFSTRNNRSTKEATEEPADSFTNSLGMRFVPVPGTNVFFCTCLTRVRDFSNYAQETTSLTSEWDNPLFAFASRPPLAWWETALRFNNEMKKAAGQPVCPSDLCPVVGVSWENAVMFCSWLSSVENRKYRLPTDHEWSCAVGIGYLEDSEAPPFSKDAKMVNVYPWGSAWPPPSGAGNYSTLLKVDDFITCLGVV